jgi:hypothetical protein
VSFDLPVVIGRTPSDCPACQAEPGSIHKPGCEVERCSVCGNARVTCGCIGHDAAFARWTGFLPGSLEAFALGMDVQKLYSTGFGKLFFVKPEK